jgi:hypothetical protein
MPKHIAAAGLRMDMAECKDELPACAAVHNGGGFIHADLAQGLVHCLMYVGSIASPLRVDCFVHGLRQSRIRHSSVQ